ncbi:hypothetical protein VB773_07585 [Haloarculaceae archaeon H-GB2-1]|nr:hypothetical protein [Haloarculaceae archaeon H-GB1-1]MEA5385933.1 hypothetical protein [Haloarculaceae archaeon H-GB11]MEA5407440.1 hypothetical protein [Haloarculaceae archaeon H-GB2-1]
MSTPPRRSVVLLCVLAFAVERVAAHGTASGSGIPLLSVLVASAAVGVASGLGAIYWRPQRVTRVLTRRRVTVLLAIGLTLLGIVYLAPVVLDRPVVALVGGSLGLSAAWSLPHRHASTASAGHHATSLTAALGVHRSVEGIVLATGGIAGGSLGTAALVVITAHAAAETALIGGVLSADGHARRAVTVVVAIQGCFLAAAVVTAVASLVLPALVRAGVLALVAGVLLFVGLQECRQCYLDVRTSPP